MIYSRLLDGQFFDYRSVFEKNREGQEEMLIGREVIGKALARAKSCGEEKTSVVFRMSGGEMYLELNSSVTYYREQLLVMEPFPGALDIAFDGNFFMKALKSFTGEAVRLSFAGQKAPVIISDDRTTHLAWFTSTLMTGDEGKAGILLCL